MKTKFWPFPHGSRCRFYVLKFYCIFKGFDFELVFSPMISVHSAFPGNLGRTWNININHPSLQSSSISYSLESPLTIIQYHLFIIMIMIVIMILIKTHVQLASPMLAKNWQEPPFKQKPGTHLTIKMTWGQILWWPEGCHLKSKKLFCDLAT